MTHLQLKDKLTVKNFKKKYAQRKMVTTDLKIMLVKV